MGGRTRARMHVFRAFSAEMIKTTRLRKLSLRHAVVLIQLTILCCAIAVSLRKRGLTQVSKKIISRSRSPWLRRFPFFHLSCAIDDVGDLAHVASRLCPRNRCLVRSLAILWLLRSRGEQAEVVLGVRKRSGVFEAHAWTVSERRLFGDRAEIIADFEALTTSRSGQQL